MSDLKFDSKTIMESLLNPLGGLNLSETETKLLFFRHIGAEYAQSAKRGRVPFATNLVRAGTAFGGLGGGTDPMMMLMLMKFMGEQDTAKVEVKEEPVQVEAAGDRVASDIPAADVETVLIEILDRLEAIEANVGKGA
mgnify:FL=1|tara:strand:- start:529 stop:942 length:414 start_codon:yes stop_codon:yes gene_type:complete